MTARLSGRVFQQLLEIRAGRQTRTSSFEPGIIETVPDAKLLDWAGFDIASSSSEVVKQADGLAV